MKKTILIGMLVMLCLVPIIIEAASDDVRVVCHDQDYGLTEHSIICDVTGLKSSVNYKPIYTIESIPNSYDHKVELLITTTEEYYETECTKKTAYGNGTVTSKDDCKDVKKQRNVQKFVKKSIDKVKENKKEKISDKSTYKIYYGETLSFKYSWKTYLDGSWSTNHIFQTNPSTWFEVTCDYRLNATTPAFINTGGYILVPFQIPKTGNTNATSTYIVNSTGQQEVFGVTGENSSTWFGVATVSAGNAGQDIHAYYGCGDIAQTNTSFLNTSIPELEIYYPMDENGGTKIQNFGKTQGLQPYAMLRNSTGDWNYTSCYANSPCLTFDGTDDFIHIDPIFSSPLTISEIYDNISIMANVMNVNDAGTSGTFHWFWQPTGSDNFALRNNADTTWSGQANFNGVASDISDIGFAGKEGISELFTFTIRGVDYTYYFNNTKEYIGSVPLNMNNLVTTADREMCLGCQDGNINFWKGNLDNYAMFMGLTLDQDEINTYNGFQNGTYAILWGSEETQAGVQVDAQDPPNSYDSPSQDVFFTCNTSAKENMEIDNITLSIWDTATSLYDSNTTPNQAAETSEYDYVWLLNIPNGVYTWNCIVLGNESSGFDWGTNYTLIVDDAAPILTLLSPLTNFTVLEHALNISFNYSAVDLTLEDCWYNLSWNSTLVAKSCNQETTLSLTESNGGSNTIYYYANDSGGNQANASKEFYFFYVNDSAIATNPITEGGTSSHTLYLNMTGIMDYGVDAWLIWNDTSQSAPTRTNISNDSVKFDISFTVPSREAEKVNWTWYYNISTSPSINNWNVSGTQDYISLNISNCNPGDYVVLNYTLLDEETKVIPNPIVNSSIKVDISLTSYSDPTFNITFSGDKVDDANYPICLPNGSLNETSYQLDAVTRYNYQDHVVEYHYIENFNLSLENAPNNIFLYDLTTDDSTSFLINYKNSYYRAVEGAIVQVWRYYVEDSEFVPVEMGQTDAGGQTVAHLVTEDVIYKFLVFLNGTLQYESEQSLALCQATPCLIDLRQRQSIEELTSIIDNLVYDYEADPDNRQTTFTWTTTDGSSTTINMTIFNFNITEVVFSQETTASGGSITGTVPMGFGNQTYFVHIYRDGQLFGTDALDLDLTAYDVFGYTGIILSAFAFLMLALMAVSSGIGVVIFGTVGLSFLGMLNLFQTGSIFGMASSFIWIIIAGGIIIWKVSKRQVQ